MMTIPKDTKIELVSLEDISSESAVAGSRVRFAVARDVVLDGVIGLHAGAPVSGVITKAKRGIAHHQWADLTIRVREIDIASGTKLRLIKSDPMLRAKLKDRIEGGLECLAELPACIVLEIMGQMGCSEDSCPTKRSAPAQQALLPSCLSEDFWVKSAVSVSSTVIAEENAAASTYPRIECARITDRSKIFGPPGISFVEFK